MAGSAKQGNALQENKRLLKRRRVMRYFIDAAKDIIDNEGLGALTIRKVADVSGYNSATLYNYFDDLAQLVAFACIDATRGWREALTRIYGQKADPLRQYLGGWRQFCETSLAHAACYAHLYIDNEDGVFKQFAKYYEVFDEERGLGVPILRALYKQGTLYGQEQVMIAPVVEAGYIQAGDAEGVYRLALLLFEGLLSRARRQQAGGGRAQSYTAEFMLYFVTFIQSRLQKQADLSQYLS